MNISTQFDQNKNVPYGTFLLLLGLLVNNSLAEGRVKFRNFNFTFYVLLILPRPNHVLGFSRFELEQSVL
jgi:hypothetical protein